MTAVRSDEDVRRAEDHANAGLWLPAGRHGSVEVQHRWVARVPALFVDGRRVPGGVRMVDAVVAPDTSGAREEVVLYRDGVVWMSSTPSEVFEHRLVLEKARQLDARRALVSGLGLGLVDAALAAASPVEHVDVVEIDPDVIGLVGPPLVAFAAQHGTTVEIHEADAYSIEWPDDARWDLAWHDVWPTIDFRNLIGIADLMTKYGPHVRWQECWERPRLSKDWELLQWRLR